MTQQTTSTDLIIKLPAVMTAQTFTDEQEFEKLYSSVKEAVGKHVPDVSSETGRKAIASLAHKVARTKTALIGQGKKLTEDWRVKTKQVNAACNTIEDRLDELKASVRKPLTEWEDKEGERIDGHKAALQALIDLSRTGFGRPSSELRELLAGAQAQKMGAAHWDEFAAQASVAQQDAIDTLTRLEAAKKAEEEEQRRRDADKAHRKQVNNAIVAELIECSAITREQAEKIAVHLVSGLVPNVTLKY
ncbi:hypothetical protein C5748_18150 [Phyllobacterium phragmitis]|uniref:Uncharacterized protein n=1 Tax=Phyllobacterium phragmitis TaxID=2670329 RepID=A0A2S9INI5_9HYPH|nr:hypothetical protein [Phyllobacterium phragmitis]PRD42078.1 hypothetical protein C5748_18150 [Phyllobacterium phragmitis]